MRRAILSILLMLMPVCALAHEEADELGHHWASHSFWMEIRYQFVVMLCIIIAVALREVVLHLRRSRR